LFSELGSAINVETDHIAPGWTDSERERLPPLLEARMFDTDRQRAFVDLTHPASPNSSPR
jgi:hypothetical protein